MRDTSELVTAYLVSCELVSWSRGPDRPERELHEGLERPSRPARRVRQEWIVVV